MKCHKLVKPINNNIGFAKCGRVLHKEGGEGSWLWKYVTCKRCLKYRED